MKTKIYNNRALGYLTIHTFESKKRFLEWCIDYIDNPKTLKEVLK